MSNPSPAADAGQRETGSAADMEEANHKESYSLGYKDGWRDGRHPLNNPTKFMHVKLGNGDIEMGAIRLANGNWAVLLQKHDTAHTIGENANNVGQEYIPTERDVVIELGNIESARVLQDAVNHALLFAVGHVPPLTANPVT